VCCWILASVPVGIVLQTESVFGPNSASPTLAQVVALIILWPFILLIGLVFGVAAVGEAAFYLFQNILRSGA
jgi:hypothetical protein